MTLMLYVLPCCTTKEGNSLTVVLTPVTLWLFVVYVTDPRMVHWKWSDSLHRVTGREGLKSSVLPSTSSALEYVKADGYW